MNKMINSEISIGSKITLSRNLKGFPFPDRMNDEQKRGVNDLVCTAVANSGECERFGFKRIDMEFASNDVIEHLFYKSLITEEFIYERQNKILLLSKDENISIMLPEQDHIKITVNSDYLELEEAYMIADVIDNAISEELPIAFNEQLGFLTQNPSDIGTGLRVATYLDLKAAEQLGEIYHISESVSKIGFSLIKINLPRLSGLSSCYRLSNSITLGITEKASIGNLKSIAEQIIDREEAFRESIKKLFS